MKLRFNLSFLLSLGLLGVFLLYILTKLDLGQITEILKQSQLKYLFLALVTSLAMIISQSLFLKKIFSLVDLDLPLIDAIRSWLVIITTGVFTIGLSGPVLIFSLLKRDRNSPVSAKVTILFYFFYILPIGLFILLTAGLYLRYQIQNQILIIFTLTVLFLGLGLILSKLFILSSLSWWQILSTILLSSLELIFNLLIFTFVILALKIQLNLPSTFQNLAIVELVSLISPSGSGVGFVEIGMGSSLALSHLSNFQAITVVIIYRLFSFWLPFLLGAITLLYFWPTLIKLISKEKVTNESVTDKKI